MKRRNGKRGFTMAEMLIVVAIIAVLSSVAFVAVAQHQRNMERVERDSVAREIFVAAQNHLTMAQGVGYYGLTGENIFGTEETGNAGVYYFVYPSVNQFSATGQPESLLDLMLPFGAVDETVRVGGSYIIRYHEATGTVMDVFYCSTDSRFGYDLNNANYAELLSDYRDNAEAKRRNYNGKVLGWYGGATAESYKSDPVTFEAPEIYIENAEKLIVGIVDKNKDASASTNGGSLHVILTGVTSGIQKEFTLKLRTIEAGGVISTYNPYEGADSARYLQPVTPATTVKVNGHDCDYAIVLDDITAPGLHFADLKGYKPGESAEESHSFTPGEDITVYAEAYDNTTLSNIAQSATLTTNSLYEKVDTSTSTASINNIRHLENLDTMVSNLSTQEISISAAVQTTDISWTDFKAATKGTTTRIYGCSLQTADTDKALTEAGCYFPVNPAADIGANKYQLLSYDGQNHNVTGIKVSYAGDAGMFGKLDGTVAEGTGSPIEISNLALIDFEIGAKGNDTSGVIDASHASNAGALAGTLTNVNVTNVVAYDKDFSAWNATNNTTSYQIKASAGHAGGLVGQATDCAISKCAASLTVQTTGSTMSSGGLIGAISSSNGTDGKPIGSVNDSYSGGHTDKGGYYKDGDAEKPLYNVNSAGIAGGLIGNVSNTPIANSYSTCSVTGATVGGFVANSTGDITNCYATGLVAASDTNKHEGAFAYSATGTISGCQYFSIINERPDAATGFTYLTALGGDATNNNITALDEDVTAYDSFVGAPSGWTSASAYDTTLTQYYQGKYNLKSVARLGASLTTEVKDDSGNVTTPADFVATHYGDWPAPEIFVLNTPST